MMMSRVEFNAQASLIASAPLPLGAPWEWCQVTMKMGNEARGHLCARGLVRTSVVPHARVVCGGDGTSQEYEGGGGDDHDDDDDEQEEFGDAGWRAMVSESNNAMVEPHDGSCLEVGSRFVLERRGSCGGARSDVSSAQASEGATTANGPSCAVVHLYDLSVVYSETFNCPSLYFKASHLDGRPLSWSEVWADVPSQYRDEAQLSTFITQKEHPLLGTPHFYIHPCQTAALLETLSGASAHGTSNFGSDTSQQGRYDGDGCEVSQLNSGGLGECGRGGDGKLEGGSSFSHDPPSSLALASFLTVYGPVVGLSVPPQAFQALSLSTRSDAHRHL